MSGKSRPADRTALPYQVANPGGKFSGNPRHAHEDAAERLLAALGDHGYRVQAAGPDSWRAQCPGHDGRDLNLSIARGDQGVLVKCWSRGCTAEQIAAAVGLKLSDLFDRDGRAEYHYAGGHVVTRTRTSGDGKRITQRNAPKAPEPTSLWTPPESTPIAEAKVVWIAEGEKSCDALIRLGVPCAATWPGGSGGVGRVDLEPLRGRDVVLVPDRDEPGRKAGETLRQRLQGVAANVKTMLVPQDVVIDGATFDLNDAADLRIAGGTLSDLVEVTAAAADPAEALEAAHATFRRWLGADYDIDALDSVLAAAAVERLDGDPLWLLVVGGPGNAKTETVQALQGAGAMTVSTIASEGALLSATSKRERTEDHTGGLLRQIGDRGVIVIKDMTSILSMQANTRGPVLGALREMYDGRWDRTVGTDGGQVLTWEGRLAVVGAVTTAWDAAHSVVSSMGDRFVLLRLDSDHGRQAAGRHAIGNVGNETQMRAELADAVAAVVNAVDAAQSPDVDEEAVDLLLAAADVVTRCRTGVEFDYRGDVIDAHAPEMPTRFAKQLAQVMRGGMAVGLSRESALRLAIRCARDSMPPLRLAIVDDVAAHPGSATKDIRQRLGKPRATVDRQLQALQMLNVLDVVESESLYRGREVTIWSYTLSDGIDPTALAPRTDLLSRNISKPPTPREESAEPVGDRALTNIPGQLEPKPKKAKAKAKKPKQHKATTSAPEREADTRQAEPTATPDSDRTPVCRNCGRVLLAPVSRERGLCERCVTDEGITS